MNIMITGGLGFIGSQLAKRLLTEGHNVTVVDDASTHELKTYDKARFPLIRLKGDVHVDRAQNIGSDILKGTDVVYHLAAVSGIKACEDNAHKARLENTKLTNSIHERCKAAGVKTLVFTSTAAVYGRAQECKEDGETIPENRYAKTKLMAERELLSTPGSTKVVVARLANVYGFSYYDKNTVVSSFVRKALRGEDLIIEGSGEQVRDFVHVKDVADALIFLAEQATGIYNVGSGRTVSVRKIAEKVIKESHSKSEIKHEPSIRNEPMPGYKYNTSKINKLGWKPNIDLTKGIRQLVEEILNDK